MSTTLHILTRPDDGLAQQVIKTEQAGAKNTVEVVDLTVPQPDYNQLLDNIFRADAVRVW